MEVGVRDESFHMVGKLFLHGEKITYNEVLQKYKITMLFVFEAVICQFVRNAASSPRRTSA